MNIQQAKEQIRRTCLAYLSKDRFGDYVMPVEAQRPVFMVGAPGVGKTAIVSQVAAELGLGLVDYSMTHHTRQSAMGLPLIERRMFDGQDVPVSEYTMSEIIASIYETMERTGRREGILFLDEINCVSETLTPMMLRFLQSKMFGTHRVPDGWVVVTAGNPVEYNRSARPFDIVTMDRVKRLDVEPDYPAWRSWAAAQGTHPAVLSFLDMRPDSFYHMETKGRVRSFVTARAWSDLSTMMKLYEAHDLPVDEELVGQYVQAPSIAKDFATYLRLFASYAEDYRIEDILDGRADSGLVEKAAGAGFDERAALGGLLVDALAARVESPVAEGRILAEVRDALVGAKAEGAVEGEAFAAFLGKWARAAREDLERDALRYRSDHAARFVRHGVAEALEDCASEAKHAGGGALAAAVAWFNGRLASHGEATQGARDAVNAGIDFIARAFGEGNELVLCLAEMTKNPLLSEFVASYDCSSYFEHQGTLMLDARAQRLRERLAELS